MRCWNRYWLYNEMTFWYITLNKMLLKLTSLVSFYLFWNVTTRKFEITYGTCICCSQYISTGSSVSLEAHIYLDIPLRSQIPNWSQYPCASKTTQIHKPTVPTMELSFLWTPWPSSMSELSLNPSFGSSSVMPFAFAPISS